MLAKVVSGGVSGVDGFLVTVECDTGPGLNSFEIVGLAEASVRESRVRIRGAIINSDEEFPSRRITINLAPADVPKRGTVYDLPQAVALLAAQEALPADAVEGSMFVGELSLNGEVRAVPGVLPMAIAARSAGLKRVYVPAANTREAGLVDGLEVCGIESLTQLLSGLRGFSDTWSNLESTSGDSYDSVVDMADVKGQEWVKEAMAIAAAGGHNLLMCGPPGSGKTMLARRIPTILPVMSPDESLETTKIYSVSGLLGRHRGLVRRRPFRAPHHTVSHVGLVGGGSFPRPGEVSLAHNGVLFLDELAEFPRMALECLRQPLEDRFVTVTRALMTTTFPASFMLVAAMNPCPCGYYGHESNRCTCESQVIHRYLSRLSGPLFDRFDLHVEVRAVKFEQLKSRGDGITSEQYRQRVDAARAIQARRFGRCGLNAGMGSAEVGRHCALDKTSMELLERAFRSRAMSARSFDRVLKVARTIADMDNSADIRCEHVSQALNYRQLDSLIQ